MKSLNKVLFAFVAFCCAFSIYSCSDDDFTETIFDTHDYPLDRTAYTFPLDTFLKVNYLEPYNLRFIYKLEDIGSDLDKNFVPVKYDNAVLLASTAKYLWFDVYKDIVGEEFLRKYSPRIIHLIGSHNYNPTTNTETLGVAEGGIKITLIRGNFIDINDLDYMNEYFFHTMHHEFSHILQQTVVTPTAFNVLSSNYNPVDWGQSGDSIVVGQGFVSKYASSQYSEDFVEVIASYITMDTISWNHMLDVASYEWESVDYPCEAYDDGDFLKARRDTLGYTIMKDGGPWITSRSGGKPSKYKIQRKTIERDTLQNAVMYSKKTGRAIPRDRHNNLVYPDSIYTDTVKLNKERINNKDTLIAYADSKMEHLVGDSVVWNSEVDPITPKFLNPTGVNGREVILKKLAMVKEWLAGPKLNVDLDKLRMEVQRRQWLTDENGNFVFDEKGHFINRFTAPDPDDPTHPFIDRILDYVNKYKALQ